MPRHPSDRRLLRTPLRLTVIPYLAILCLAIFLQAPLMALDVPFLAGRVNDLAQFLDSQAELQLESVLEQLENATGAQVAILTLPNLEGEPLEDYSIRVVETWELGREGIDDGILLLVSRDDRKIRIEVGYGLESTLTDLRTKKIVSNLMVPRFRDGDFAGGITAAVEVIDATVRGQEDLIPPSLHDSTEGDMTDAPLLEKLIFLGVFSVVVGTFAMISIASSGCMGWFLYLFLMPFFFSFPAAIFGPTAGTIAWLLWVVAFPVLRFLLRSTGWGERLRSWTPNTAGWSRSWSSGGGGWSSGGGGGFSGGGGSFGGGGASGSW